MERAIAALIKDQITDMKVAAISDGRPSKPSGHSTGAIYVMYTGSRYQNKLDALVFQDRVVMFEIHISVKALKDSNDAVDRLDSVRSILTGQALQPNYGKIKPVSDSFVDEEGTWYYYKAVYSFDCKNTEEALKNVA